MSTHNKPSLADLYPLPEGVKLRSHKFGPNPFTGLQPVHRDQIRLETGTLPPEFQLQYKDENLGLLVDVNEDLASHRLIAKVYTTHPEHLNQAAVSVAVVGTIEDHMIHKTIPFKNKEDRDGYCCSGFADFGKLDDVVRELGDKIGLIVFLVI